MTHEITAYSPHRYTRYFCVQKFCGDFAIYEIIKNGKKKFERRVASNIENEYDAELMASALTAAEGMK